MVRELCIAAMGVAVAFGCGKRGGQAAPEPTAPPTADAASGDSARPSPSPTGVAIDVDARAGNSDSDRAVARQFLAALDEACKRGSQPPELPLRPSQFRAVVERPRLIEGALNVACIRRKLGLPQDEPAGLEEAMLLAHNPFPVDWVERLETMCADPGFTFDDLSNLRFPENQYFLAETPREDGMRALAAARCLARRIAGNTPPSKLRGGARGLMVRLSNLYQAITARYGG